MSPGAQKNRWRPKCRDTVEADPRPLHLVVSVRPNTLASARPFGEVVPAAVNGGKTRIPAAGGSTAGLRN